MVTAPRRRLWGSLAIALGTLALLAAAATWYFSPPRYDVVALLKVSATPPVVLGNAAQIDREEFAIFKRTQVQLLKSNVVLNGVLRDSQINQLPTVQAHADEPVAWLKESLLIDYPDDAEIMRISLRGNRPDDLVEIVDTVVEVYLKEIVQREKQLRQRQESELQAAYERQTAEYQKTLDALRALEAIHKTSGSGEAQIKKELEQAQLDSLLAQRRKVRDRLEETELEIKLQQATERQPNEARTSSAETGPASQPAGEPPDNEAPGDSPEPQAPEQPPAQAPRRHRL